MPMTPIEDNILPSDELQRLQAVGFTVAGHWAIAGNGLSVELSQHATAHNVLYAFVTNGQLMYLGKIVKPLAARMSQYKTPSPSQSTNVKNHHNIRSLLQQGKSVTIYILPDNGLLHYGGFHVNLAAGLEDSLVRELQPPWNRGQKETPRGPWSRPSPSRRADRSSSIRSIDNAQ